MSAPTTKVMLAGLVLAAALGAGMHEVNLRPTAGPTAVEVARQ